MTGATPAGSGSQADAPSPQTVSAVPVSIPSANPFNAVWDNQPLAPARGKAVEVYVVGKRCVYLNDYRIAGGKPYFSENLPAHILKTSLGEVLDAFSEADIRKALKEKKQRRDYFAEYHRQRAASVKLAEQVQS